MPKYQYKIGPEKEGHIWNGDRLFVGAVIESETPIIGSGFELIPSKTSTISAPVREFSEPSASSPDKSAKKGKE